MFYFYSGEKPENPCEKCGFYKDNDCTIYDTELLCPKFKTYADEQSIISKLVEVDLGNIGIKLQERIFDEWNLLIPTNALQEYVEQFIQQQINLSNKSNSSEDGKDDKESC